MSNWTCGHAPDLYKVTDDLWAIAGFQPTDIACIDCLQQCLGGCVFSCGDMDHGLDWWGDERREYRLGICDGLAGDTNAAPVGPRVDDYRIGVAMGLRLRENSSPEEIEFFISSHRAMFGAEVQAALTAW